MLLSAALAHLDVDSDLTLCIIKLAAACQEIHHALQCALPKALGTSNEFGDKQLSVDLIAEEIMWTAVKREDSACVAGASEENPHLQLSGHGGRFVVFWDPLDGSSIIDANFAVGTIIGIMETSNQVTAHSGQDCEILTNTLLKKPLRESWVASIIAVHGPRLSILVSVKDKTLDFFLNTQGQLVMNSPLEGICLEADVKTKYFAPANLRVASEDQNYKEVIDFYTVNKYTLRYSGGLVPDIYHIVCKRHGVFINPTSSNCPAKCRLLYECAPIAHVIECAQGSAVDERGTKILDLPVLSLDHRTSLIAGVDVEVARCVKFLQQK